MKNKIRTFDLSKKKYVKEEVEEMLDGISSDYDNLIATYKDKIKVLTESNKELSDRVKEFEKKDGIIGAAIKDSEEKAFETQSKAEMRYNLACEKLRKFSEKWEGYFNFLKEKYPYYPIINKSLELKDRVKTLLKSSDKEKAFSVLDKEVVNATKKSVGFNPKEKINNYVAATSSNGFDLDEVLNPGDLQLEDLCKELGLIDGSK